jgi:hypothetical protein
MTEPDEAIKFAEAMMRSYNHLSDVVIPPTAPLRIDGRRLTGIEAHNVTQAFAQAYRAGQAASAERIKALEHIAGAAQQRANDHGEQLLDAYERIKALEEALRGLIEWKDDIIPTRLWSNARALLKEADQ